MKILFPFLNSMKFTTTAFCKANKTLLTKEKTKFIANKKTLNLTIFPKFSSTKLTPKTLFQLTNNETMKKKEKNINITIDNIT